MDMINQSGTDSKSWLTSANFFPAEVSLTVGTKFAEYQFLLIFKILSIPIYITLLQLSQLVHWIGWLREQQMVPYPPRGFSSSWCDVFYWGVFILSNLYTLGSIEIYQSLTFFPMPFFSVPSRLLCPLSPQSYCVCDSWPAQTDNPPFQGSKIDFLGSKVHGIRRWWFRNPEAEANHLACLKNPANHGMKYQPQVVSRIAEPSTVPTKQDLFLLPRHPRQQHLKSVPSRSPYRPFWLGSCFCGKNSTRRRRKYIF